MKRRVGFTLVLLTATLAATSTPAWAQTTTTPPATTAPRTTLTTVRPTTVAPTTRVRPTTPVVTPTTSAPAPSTSIAPLGETGSRVSGRTIALIVGALALLLLVALVIFLLVRQRSTKQWSDQAAHAAADGRRVLGLVTHGLATLDQPAAAAHTWSELEAEGAQLHQRLQTLNRRPPTEWMGSAVAGTDQSLQALRSAADADRALRLGPPPPTTEQLGYSEAVVRQRAADFEQELGGLESALARGSH